MLHICVFLFKETSMSRCYIETIPAELWEIARIAMEEKTARGLRRKIDFKEHQVWLETFKEYLGLSLQEMYCIHYVPRTDGYVCNELLRAIERKVEFGYDGSLFKLFNKVRENYNSFSLKMILPTEIIVVDEE